MKPIKKLKQKEYIMEVFFSKPTKKAGVYKIKVCRGNIDVGVGAVSMEIVVPELFEVTAVSNGKNLHPANFMSNILPNGNVRIGWYGVTPNKGAELAIVSFKLKPVVLEFSKVAGMCELADANAVILPVDFNAALFTTTTVKMII
jgi:hypothetical protein